MIPSLAALELINGGATWYQLAKERGVPNPDAVRYVDQVLATDQPVIDAHVTRVLPYPQPSSGGDEVNWEAIGAIGQAISALALVIVIVQVRLSTAETLRSIRQDRTADERRTLSENAQSEWLSRVVVKGMKAYEGRVPNVSELVERGLTEEEAWAFGTYMYSWWLFDTQNIAHIDKLSKGERVRFDALMRIQYQGEAKRRFFEQARPILNPDAVRYIDNLLGQPG
jgi:hypothetical protein